MVTVGAWEESRVVIPLLPHLGTGLDEGRAGLTWMYKAWARKGSLRSTRPLRPSLFLWAGDPQGYDRLTDGDSYPGMCMQTPPPACRLRGLQSWFPVPTKPGDVTEQQAEARHIILDKANHLQLTKCQQLLPWVDDLALGQAGIGSQHRLRPEPPPPPCLDPPQPRAQPEAPSYLHQLLHT